MRANFRRRSRFLNRGKLPTITVILWPTLYFVFFVYHAGKISHLTCKNLEWRYTQCRLQNHHFYGTWADPPISFRVREVLVEEFIKKDSEGQSYNAYRLIIKTRDLENAENNGQVILFHDYDLNYSQAYHDSAQILDVVSGATKSGIELKRSRTHVFQDLMFPLAMSTVAINFLWIATRRITTILRNRGWMR